MTLRKGNPTRFASKAILYLLVAVYVGLLGIVVSMAGCATLPDDRPMFVTVKTYCIGGYAHSYSYNYGYRQVLDKRGDGVPCA